MLFGGALADRLPQRRVLVVSDIVRAAGLLCIGGLALADALAYWQLVLGALVVGVGDAFFIPAYSALVPRIVALAVAGATGSAAMALWGTLLQRRVPEMLRGRVSSLDFFVSIALLPIATAVAAPAATAFGVEAVFAAAGVGPLVAALAIIGLARLDRDELGHPLHHPADRRRCATACAIANA